MKYILLTLLQLYAAFAAAQVSENFADGDFTTNPPWTGNTADFTVNAAKQLQSNNTIANSSFYISTANTLATAVQWEFYMRLAFNTSSANYVDVFLTASASDITAGSTTGYFLRIGSTQDDICLYRKDASGSTRLIDGLDGLLNTSDNTLKIKVTRDAGHVFTLYRDAGGTGTSYVSEGTATDATYLTSSFFGIWIKQSTATFFQRHYFDDISVQPYVPDVTPPSIRLVTALSATTLDVLFSEPVDATAQTLTNYNANNGIGVPALVQRDAINPALVHLTFATAFPNGLNNILTVNGVKDLAGNAMTNGTAGFSFYTAQRYDVVIDEIMADPSPSVSLPDAEYIELKNTSGRSLNLSGWRIATASSVSGAFADYSLPADSFLIITSNAAAALFSGYGRVLGVSSFPSLNNDGTTLSLLSREGKTIHAVAYTADWYNNTVKSDGGWSLEMIDTRNPCNGQANWKASTNSSGGTPGKKNSVDGINTDKAPPQLLRTYSIDSLTVIAVFDEGLDSAAAATAGNYSFNSLSVSSATPQGPLFNTILIKLAAPMQHATVYTLTVNGLKDCSGNTIGSFNTAKAGIAEEAGAADIIINEILFNPRPNAYDYLEFYNKSNKILDGSELYIANRNGTVIANIKKWSEGSFYIYPGDYMVLTENPTSLSKEYGVKNPAQVLAISSLPSYPDDKGNIVVTNMQGAVIDEVAYSDKWHFALITNTEGVALERINPAGPSQDASNWHSAATTAGYGTPTYQNSQYGREDTTNATITVSPKIFSPDNDGYEDIATILYSIETAGYVANITIFDAAGRPVRYLVKNALLGTKGSWNWDGLNEKLQKLPIGTYIIYTELFNLEGKKKHFKNTIVLARKIN